MPHTQPSDEQLLRCHREGWEAFASGKRRADNPYDDGRGVAWNTGWKDAAHEFRHGDGARRAEAMTQRHPYDGQPYYCAICGADFAEYLACDSENFDCSLESTEDAQARLYPSHEPRRHCADELAEDATARSIAAKLKGCDLEAFERQSALNGAGENVILLTAIRYERARRRAFPNSPIGQR